MEFLLEQEQTVVFAGDSITDAGCTLRLGAVGERFLGEGWVRDVVGLIDARYPAHGLVVHNTGIGGIHSGQLAELWDEHVLAHRPDWVTIMIGINDCNLTLMGHEQAVPPQQYEKNLRDVLTRTREAGARVVLLDPFFMWLPDAPGDDQLRTLDLLAQYHEHVHAFVEEFDAVHVRTHEAFQEQLRFRPLAELGIEPVHPTPSGHLVIAHALLRALGW